MKKGFTVFLIAGIIALPNISYAQESLKPIITPEVKSIYKISEKVNLPKQESPIEMGTLSSKIFQDDTIVEQGSEKIKYINKAIPKQIAKKAVIKKIPEELKKELIETATKAAKKVKPKPVRIAKVIKQNHPKGTIFLLDKTIIQPEQKVVQVAGSSKKVINNKAKKIAKIKTYTSGKIAKIQLNYLADESEIEIITRKKLLQFVRKLRNKNNGSVKIVTSSIPVPFQEEQTLAETRIKYVKAFMREQGVNPAKYNFSAVHKKSKKGKQQYLVMEYVS